MISAIRNMLLMGVVLAAAAPLAAEPFSSVYVHPAEFADPALAPEAREALMDQTLEDIKACGFTTVTPYANTSSGEVYWPGSPAEMAGAKDWDTLGIFAHKARERGLKVMPALCVLVCGHDGPTGILKAHPEWAMRDDKEQPIGWISPENAEARAWLKALVLSLAAHVQPDGIMFDYLRFSGEGTIFDPAGAAEFEAMAKPENESPEARKERLQQFKEASLSRLMAELATGLRAQNPSLRIGLYSWGANVSQNHPVAQRWPDWVRDGYLDLLNVSGYCYRDNYGDTYLKAFEQRLREAGALARQNGRVELTFALGVKTSHGAIATAAEMTEYMAIARRLGYTGVAAFAWRSVAPFTKELAASGCFRLSEPWPATRDKDVTYRMTFDPGKDTGQHLGSLFQITDASGRAVMGAGFEGAYNTYYRSDRFLLHVFARPADGADPLGQSPFTRPSEAPGHYLFNVPGGLAASDRASQEKTRRWNTETEKWEAAGPPVFQVGKRQFKMYPNRLIDKGKTVFSFDPEVGTAGLYYYAAGHLFFHEALANTENRQTFIAACPWDPETEEKVSMEGVQSMAMGAPGEFPYAYGQLHGDVFAATNNGGLYRFRDGDWSIQRASDPNTSFQIYSMINYYDRLLMGQYPTGELFEIVGGELRQVPGWSLLPAGASPRAREAQTLALYRGELFAGVWPWGEVWRLSGPDAAWSFCGRLFTRPEVQETVTAPYEEEMTTLGEKVNNLWGQRVTSLVPQGDGLLAGTSNKNGAPCEERLQFLGEGLCEEYGAVYRLFLPGHRSVPVPWTGAARELEVRFTATEMRVSLDGMPPVVLPLDLASLDLDGAYTWHWGQGIFGPLYGTVVAAGRTK